MLKHQVYRVYTNVQGVHKYIIHQYTLITLNISDNDSLLVYNIQFHIVGLKPSAYVIIG